jgi:hypothetical protein
MKLLINFETKFKADWLESDLRIDIWTLDWTQSENQYFLSSSRFWKPPDWTKGYRIDHKSVRIRALGTLIQYVERKGEIANLGWGKDMRKKSLPCAEERMWLPCAREYHAASETRDYFGDRVILRRDLCPWNHHLMAQTPMSACRKRTSRASTAC